MGKDRFKDFVDKNRDSFDNYQSDYPHMWDEIASGLERKRREYKPWWAAAVVFLIALAFMGIRSQKLLQDPKELTEAETHYQPMIAAKMQVIQAHHEEIDAIVWDDLQILDYTYEELKLDLKEQADSEEVMQAIIENYRIKLDILDQILNEIEAKEDEKQQEQQSGA